MNRQDLAMKMYGLWSDWQDVPAVTTAELESPDAQS